MKTQRPWLGVAFALLLLSSACSTAAGPDPWRGYNEPVFGFNDGLDRYLLGPVARGWDWLAPGFVLTGVDNFFRNLDMPRTFVNDVLQAKPVPAAHDFGRFVVNSTVGVAGFVDVASMIGIRENREDFGQTLGYWGTPSGPFAILPVLPFRCTVRDWLAYPVDMALDPALLAGFSFQIRVRHRRGRRHQPPRHQRPRDRRKPARSHRMVRVRPRCLPPGPRGRRERRRRADGRGRGGSV